MTVSRGMARGATVKTSNAIAAWNKADLIFLMDALKRSVAEADVARFLGRSEDEVREQANALKQRRASQGAQSATGAG